MRWLFLVAGLCAGLAVGLTVGHRATPRSPRAPVVQRVEPSRRTAPPADPPPAALVPAPPVVEPTGDVPPEEGDPDYGRIEVDFEGFDGERRAWIGRTALSGSREEEDLAPDKPGTVAQFDVVPGVCAVWCLVGPRRVGARVRVAAGRVVRLRAAELDTAVLPRDLAVLGVRVSASWGGPLPSFRVGVEAADDVLDLRTNLHGCVSARVRPGTVNVRVGDQITPVALLAGRETVVEVRHRAEGDVLLDGPHAGAAARLGLRPAGGGRATRHPLYAAPGKSGFLYVRTGEYEVFRKLGTVAGGGTVLGTVTVLAGQASLLRLELPPGTLEIRVELPAEPARKTPYVLVSLQSVDGYGVRFVDQVQGVRRTLDGRFVYRVRVDGLHPGRYRLICGTASETVEVAAGVTEVVLRPPR